MKNIAFLFPGQGAQYPGMGRDFFESFAVARQTFEEADDLLAFRLSNVIFEGPDALLTETRHSQLAIFVHSAAILRALQEQCPELIPAVCAGLSLGEYTALFASKRCSFAETLNLVRRRSEFLNEACEKTQGSMCAVLGLNAGEVEEILHPVAQVWVANFNCPGQTVISGTKSGIETATAALKMKGAKRIVPLQVHGAFHSGLMLCAQEKLTPVIASAHICDSSIDFVMNVPGAYVQGIDQVKDNLVRQVTHSVRWEQSIQAMKKRNIQVYLEIGPGKTLSGMNRKMGAEAAYSIEKVADLDGVLKDLSCN